MRHEGMRVVPSLAERLRGVMLELDLVRRDLALAAARVADPAVRRVEATEDAGPTHMAEFLCAYV